ncbi:DNA polymerase IV [Atopobacter phocae]|uniref:DNA polymerase IV n=1 Tax=Atopobacter phocae TaxID=136492 RepID=UPI00046E5527|nr:DNA polymerase IV [Atopobacter phocae]
MFQYGLLEFHSIKNDTSRKIIHIDMDAFYASIEIRDNPSLKNKPVVIGNHPLKTNKRGIVATCNYIARSYGIHSAMSVKEAYELCPKAIFIRPRMSYYKEISAEIREIFKRTTSMIEPLSIDEAFLDVTSNYYNCSSATLIAQRIQREIYKDIGLTCSAGVSYNKFLAKIASDQNKPAGLTVIPPEEALPFLMELPIEDFRGVGKRSSERFIQLNIKNGSDLIQWSYEDLYQTFGQLGHDLFFRVRGIDNRPVNQKRARQSVGREQTYRELIYDTSTLFHALREVTDRVSADLERLKLKGRVITLKIRYRDFTTLTKQMKLDFYLKESIDIFRMAKYLFEEIGSIERGIRLAGVTISDLEKNEYEQAKLLKKEIE